MEKLKKLLDYQRFARNPRLQEQLDMVYHRYLAQGEALEDEALDVAAAGEPLPPGRASTAEEQPW